MNEKKRQKLRLFSTNWHIYIDIIVLNDKIPMHVNVYNNMLGEKKNVQTIDSFIPICSCSLTDKTLFLCFYALFIVYKTKIK